MRKLLLLLVVPLVVAGLAVPALASAKAPPVCEKVTVQENPAFPNPQITYPITLCGDKALPVRSLTVDGAALPEHPTTHTRVVFWSNTAAKASDLLHATLTAQPSRRCSRSISTSGNAYSVVITVHQSCGRSYRAWLDWSGGTGGGTRYGTYTKVNGKQSVACVNNATCGGGVGTVLDGGYQRKTDGKFFCTYLCTAGHIHTVALARPVPGTANLSTGSCHNEYVSGTSNLDGTDPQTQWVKGNGTTVNGCGWQQRCHAHFGIPKQGDDDGWVNGGWVRSATTVSGCKSPDGDGFFVFDVQYRSSNGIVHSYQFAP